MFNNSIIISKNVRISKNMIILTFYIFNFYKNFILRNIDRKIIKIIHIWKRKMRICDKLKKSIIRNNIHTYREYIHICIKLVYENLLVIKLTVKYILKVIYYYY